MISKPTAAKAMTEIERQSRAAMTAKFKLWDQMKALAEEYGTPDYNLAVELTERGLSIDEARREFASRAAVRG